MAPRCACPSFKAVQPYEPEEKFLQRIVAFGTEPSSPCVDSEVSFLDEENKTWSGLSEDKDLPLHVVVAVGSYVQKLCN
eukprot:2750804-Rhodomonas_salina.4